MKTTIEGKPAFAYIHVDLEPGESIVAESDAMATMSAKLDMKARFNGGFFKALLLKIFGGESLFVNEFKNKTKETQRVTLVQKTPGDIAKMELKDSAFCFQPGAYVCRAPQVKLKLRWAGFRSFIAREGLFKIEMSGTGPVWYGSYGALLEKQVDGEILVDTSHLVAYEPHMKFKLQLAGGLFSSFLGGEGFVSRLEGQGKVVIQTRSVSGLAGWLNPKL